MPLRARHRHEAARQTKCAYGGCPRPADPHYHVTLDLGDGKPPITIYACSRDHLEQILGELRRLVVSHA